MSQIKLIVVSLVLFASIANYAQTNLLNAKVPQQIGVKTQEQLAADNDKPLEYGYIDDRDIFWSKVVWEFVDLNERLNLPFYYPIDTMRIASDRRSLYDTLLRGIKQNKITEVYDDSYFTGRMSYEEIQSKLVRYDTLPEAFDILNADPNADISEYVDKYTIDSEHIEAFMVKGVWYIDTRQGEMKYRLLGIAPIAPDVQTIGRDNLGNNVDERLPLFWVFYPNAREVMHEMKVFNPNNAAFPISFDHLLNAHRFNALIYKEENVYGDREVKSYVKGNSLFQVLESEKLKEDIRNKELDIWNY
ncbi:MAG: gliding motility protein GldN [Flavobacteriaceae bacterium]|jgi:gliding motility associated protien GldN|nr:gliding motility protein GldN [Flavobacteriaceae bacterium]